MAREEKRCTRTFSRDRSRRDAARDRSTTGGGRRVRRRCLGGLKLLKFDGQPNPLNARARARVQEPHAIDATSIDGGDYDGDSRFPGFELAQRTKGGDEVSSRMTCATPKAGSPWRLKRVVSSFFVSVLKQNSSLLSLAA